MYFLNPQKNKMLHMQGPLQVSRVLVAAQEPHLILSVECSLESLLGHVPHELVGQSINALKGSDTDVELLRFLIPTNTEIHSRVMLYEKNGKPRMMDVSCEPLYSPSNKTQCCLMSLRYSTAITMSEALSMIDCPCVLISDLPHRVELANQMDFHEIEGNAVDLVDKSAMFVKPSETLDSTWQSMITAAFQGSRTHHKEATRTSDGRAVWLEMIFVPVVNLPNQRPGHVLIRYLLVPREDLEVERNRTATPCNLPTTPLASATAEPNLRPVRQDWRTARTPLIMDEAYVRRLRRRLVAAARRDGTRAPARKRTPTADKPAGPCPARTPSLAAGAVSSQDAAPSELAVALAPCTPPSALDHDCDVAAGRWWDEATEAELLRPAAAVPCPPRAQRPAGPLSS